MRDRLCVYRDILNLARRRVDDARWRADRARAAVEAAHLALIPPLLTSSDDRRHRHYLDIERARFVRACRRDGGAEFQLLWTELDALTPRPEPDVPIPFARSILPFRLNYQARTVRDATKPT